MQDIVYIEPQKPNVNTSFQAALRRRAPGLLAADEAVLRWTQDFHLPEAERRIQPLAILIEKNNLDKHKALQPLQISANEYYADRITWRDCNYRGIELVPPGQVLEVGTELARIYIRNPGPNPNVQVEGYVTADVHISQGYPLVTFLNDLRKWMIAALSGFSDYPRDINRRVGNV